MESEERNFPIIIKRRLSMRKSGASGNKITPNRKLIRKSASRQDLRGLNDKVTLKHILGLTTTNTNGLASNPTSGIIAYPAGCVIVLYNTKTNIQKHILNPDKKTITCVSFSPDGRYLVSGESGQQPSVRVWDLNENLSQVAELRGHKSGINAVEFSPNNKLLVSIGDQHDMLVNVWNWKLGHTVACNKSGCRVRSVSFSESGNYLVTVGNRHVKFWYLDQEATSKGNAPITPITGRAGILGDQRNNCFTDVKCGRGKNSAFTYCVTKSSLLCMFNERRIMDKWVELKAGSANCLEVTENYIFCGCSNGLIRVFDPTSLRFVASFPRPHNLGVNVSEGLQPTDLVHVSNKSCPDLVAITLDSEHFKMTSIYNDHSLYVWDLKNIKKVGKVASFLYHSACIWGVETYPYFDDSPSACLPYGSFLTCSSDDTIRIWNIETGNTQVKMYPRNLYSKELLKIVYIDEDLSNIQDTSMAPFGKDTDGKNGVRCMQISPDGQILATGDRSGNLRIYSLDFFDETFRIEAHESEILCVEFSPEESGYKLLASSSRDRLIHIFDVMKKYTLLQTIDDHSSSITAVRFNYDENILQLLSCGADKVVMFHTAQTNENGVCFVRNTIVPGKATLYDMGIEPTRKYAATVGQDRNMRVYNVQEAKQTTCFKGSLSDEGNLIKFQLDGGGVYAAISCSDKTIGIFDFVNGECEASMHGHSEIATGLKFTADGKHLISVSGDGCIFVWNLPPALTENIRNRILDLNAPLPQENDYEEDARRKTFVVSGSDSIPTDPSHLEESISNGKTPAGYRFSVGQLPLWAQKQMGNGQDGNGQSKGQSQPMGRWGQGGLGPVTEQALEIPHRKFSEDSIASAHSENPIDGEPEEVIYPPIEEDTAMMDPEKTFYVTESRGSQSANKTFNQNGETIDLNGTEDVDTETDPEKESDMDRQSSSDVESDNDEAFSPLMEHFEELATPAKILSASRSRSSSSTEPVEPQNALQQKFVPGHRASISAKFLSRSQKSSSTRSSTNSTGTADEQRKRLENARNVITNNLKKTKNISKSCVNLSFTQELDDLRNSKEKFKNTIPSTPSTSSINDLLTSDPRRSSTPMNNHNRKWNNRRTTNAWSSQKPQSPIGSPLANHQSQSVTDLFRNPAPLSPLSNERKTFPESSPVSVSTENVVRRSGARRNRSRPRSMVIEPTTVRDKRSEIRISRADSLRTPSQSHSDTEIEESTIENSVFNSITKTQSVVTSPTRPTQIPEMPVTAHISETTVAALISTPTKDGKREIDIDEQLLSESEAERVRRIAQQINDNVRHLQQQNSLNGSRENIEEDELRDTKELIRLYETGLIGTHGKLISCSPPERDVPSSTSEQQNSSKIEEKDEDTHKETENHQDEDHLQSDHEQATCDNVGNVTLEECKQSMDRLVESFRNASEIEKRLLKQPTSDQQRELLTVINKTYQSLQETLTERTSRLQQYDDITKNNLHVLNSDTFKQFQDSIAKTQTTPEVSEQATSVDVINMLDKYSNVLVDMISSKIRTKDSLTE
uniref:MABP1/WDR62 second WD40 domain-containing protein n=1 Tax=Clytia hemisphaerica TaxID=252671 RepID=A0A7M5WY06_9CNID